MRFADMSAPAIRDAAGKTIALLPVAAIEQHGPHLAVSTDTAIVTAIASQAEEHLPEQVVLCPTLPYGSSHHHLPFGGTISLPPDLYTQVVVELVRSLAGSGFRRIVLLNGHGGNITPIRQALSLLSAQLGSNTDRLIALATYWELGGKTFAGEPPMETPALSHACEYETSMMLYLYPQRAWPDRVLQATRPEINDYVYWEGDGPYRGVSMVRPFDCLTNTGAMGKPELATQAKGRHLVQAAVDTLVQFLRDFSVVPPMPSLRDQRETI